jgi:hypothetical protein
MERTLYQKPKNTALLVGIEINHDAGVVWSGCMEWLQSPKFVQACVNFHKDFKQTSVWKSKGS